MQNILILVLHKNTSDMRKRGGRRKNEVQIVTKTEEVQAGVKNPKGRPKSDRNTVDVDTLARRKRLRVFKR